MRRSSTSTPVKTSATASAPAASSSSAISTVPRTSRPGGPSGSASPASPTPPRRARTADRRDDVGPARLGQLSDRPGRAAGYGAADRPRRTDERHHADVHLHRQRHELRVPHRRRGLRGLHVPVHVTRADAGRPHVRGAVDHRGAAPIRHPPRGRSRSTRRRPPRRPWSRARRGRPPTRRRRSSSPRTGRRSAGSTAAPFQECASPYKAPALAAGAHVFEVRARDAAGNVATSSRAFTVTVPQQQTPTPTPSATPTRHAHAHADAGAQQDRRGRAGERHRADLPVGRRQVRRAARQGRASRSARRWTPRRARSSSPRSRRPARRPRPRSSTTASSRSRSRAASPTSTLVEPLAPCAKAQRGAPRQEGQDPQAVGRRQGRVPHDRASTAPRPSAARSGSCRTPAPARSRGHPGRRDRARQRQAKTTVVVARRKRYTAKPKR